MKVICKMCDKTIEIDENLSAKELQILKFIKNYAEKYDKPPSFREISTKYKISLSAIDRYIYQLKEKQYITKKPYKSRSIVILKDIPCG